MACVVYCLVPDPEHLDSVVERIKDAGVKSEDIAVVPRRHWARRPAPAGSTAAGAESGDASAFPSCFWSFSLGPAAWWWQWAMGVPDAELAAKPGQPAVIPLKVYERKLGKSKRK